MLEPCFWSNQVLDLRDPWLTTNTTDMPYHVDISPTLRQTGVLEQSGTVP